MLLSLQDILAHTVATPSCCREWIGGRWATGYGRIQINRKAYVASRLAYEAVRGPIPEGFVVCHRCDNPPCVNPAHLFLGTIQDNNTDRHRKGRTASGERSGPIKHRQVYATANRLRAVISPHSYAIGEKSGHAKITVAQAMQMKFMYETGDYTLRGIGEMFGVSFSAVSSVVRGKTWKKAIDIALH